VNILRFKKWGFWVSFCLIVLLGFFFIVLFNTQTQTPVIPDVNAQMSFSNAMGSYASSGSYSSGNLGSYGALSAYGSIGSFGGMGMISGTYSTCGYLCGGYQYSLYGFGYIYTGDICRPPSTTDTCYAFCAGNTTDTCFVFLCAFDSSIPINQRGVPIKWISGIPGEGGYSGIGNIGGSIYGSGLSTAYCVGGQTYAGLLCGAGNTSGYAACTSFCNYSFPIETSYSTPYTTPPAF
jgi:hypothetical protein